ncbi:MAG: ATP-binding protein [Candidatus Symbiothrix sp.]|jgi:predicted ATP-binding protein involved in virulence|nr:ATP-binding protein [Candidatus Symbiothrix sp.]
MEKWIKNISGIVPHTNNNVDIELDGKNLIVTGANGSGKTSFLKEVYERMTLCITEKKYADLQVTISKNINFPFLYKDRKAVVLFFEEKRLSDIKRPTMPKSVLQEEEDARKHGFSQRYANNLEQHLVNLISRQSLAITKDKNQVLADEIESWFNDFEKSLKILFEDESIRLELDSDKFQFSICQDNKPPFTFQTLSAGYRAIFDIYAELIMHTEYFKIMPTELTGVVFIDEIDSHLHVSLQRLIFPFFTQSFPKIQFIVTTHSPFVLMSATDTVIFDLANSEPITEDLSYYTYSSIMKGLWNVKPISVKLENSIKEIAEIVNSEQKDFTRLQQLTDEVQKHAGTLDNESKAFYLLGLKTLAEGGDNV